jgi:hypothetical protein
MRHAWVVVQFSRIFEAAVRPSLRLRIGHTQGEAAGWFLRWVDFEGDLGCRFV